MTRITEGLRDPSVAGSPTVTVFGLGGVGKTALALSFAHAALESATYPHGVYWLAASGDAARAMSKLAPILREHAPTSIAAHIPTAPQSPSDIAESVRVALGRAPSPLLLVLDDVDVSDWQAMLPGSANVHVVITTKDRRFAQGLELHLDALPPDEAIQLAGDLAGQRSGDTEAQVLDRVVNARLGGIALAVEMAAKSVLRWSISWSRYELMLENECVHVLESAELGTHYPRGVFGAIELSIGRCPPESAELRLLRAVAVFAAEPVPSAWALAVAGLDLDGFEGTRAVGVLSGLGLIRPAEEDGTLAIHRLVHKWVRLKHPPTPYDTRATVQLVRDWICTRVDPLFSAEVERHETHIREALDRGEVLGDDASWIEIGRSMVSHLRFRGAYAEALELVKRVLRQAEGLEGSAERLIADLKADVGVGYLDVLQPQAALAWLDDALKLHEELLGPSDLQVAVTRTNIGIALAQLDRNEEAVDHFVAAFEIDRRNLPDWNPNRHKFLGNLGAALCRVEHSKEGLAVLEAAADLAAQVHGSSHPYTAAVQANLGAIYFEEGRYDEARRVFGSALSGVASCHDEFHPLSALALSSLSVVEAKEGRFASAVKHGRRALEIARRVCGPDAAETAQCMSNLATTLVDIDRDSEAIILLEEACHIMQQRRGAKSTHARTVGINLADVLRKHAHAHDPPAAYELYERAIAAYQGADEHQGVAAARMELALTSCRKGDIERARELFCLALPVLESRPGAPPDSAAGLTSKFAGAHEDAGKLALARELFHEAIEIRLRGAKPDLYRLSIDRGNLARVLRKEGREPEARELVAAAIALLDREECPADEATGHALGALAEAQAELGDFEAALSTSERSFSILETACGPSDPGTTAGLLQRIDLLETIQRFDDALPLYEECIRRISDCSAREYFDIRDGVLRRQAGALLRVGRHDQCLEVLDQRLHLLQADEADRRLLVAETYQLMAQVQRSGCDFAAALQVAERAHATLASRYAEGTIEFAVSACNLALAQTEAGLAEEARGTIDRACADAARLLPVDHPLQQWFRGTRDLIHGNDAGDGRGAGR